MTFRSMHEHFSQIAPAYRGLRVTDPEPIFHIVERLRGISHIKAADVGCGAGRYDLELFQHLGDKIKHIYCLDATLRMLEQVRDHLRRHHIRDFEGVRSVDRHLPFTSNHLNCIFTFNAVHHLDIMGFLGESARESARVLQRRGFLCVYTRFRSQNSRSIWGRHFPHFSEKETRLYESGELEKFVSATPTLETEHVQFFTYPRVNTLERLVELAANRHYSTFCRFSESELQASLEQFESNIRENFEDPESVEWTDENVMLTIRKD